jgi:hypothetical protein
LGKVQLIDIVILVAPIHLSKTLISSQNDPSILQATRLGGLIETESDNNPADHKGLALPLPPSTSSFCTASIHTQVRMTVLSNTALQNDTVLLAAKSSPPWSMCYFPTLASRLIQQ